jgi:2-polyprenyl-6-hydroxyphenyl methylase/3-demethylubiquinone-9 3-methyltransferase
LTEPYYLRIKNPREFLNYYLNIYKGDYSIRRAKQVISLFPELSDKRVLDIGCGGGFYSLAAHKKGARIQILTDSSPVCVKAAKLNLFENAGVNSEGVISNASNLPFRSGYFDFVLCIDLIEHMQNDDAFLHEIRRILKNNGILLVATQNSNSLNYLIETPIQRYILKNRNWMGWDTTHVRFYNPKQLRRLLRDSNFSCTKIAGTYFIPYNLSSLVGKISEKLSQIAYNVLIKLNDKLEQDHEAFWNLFGWGILYLCAKIQDFDRSARI